MSVNLEHTLVVGRTLTSKNEDTILVLYTNPQSSNINNEAHQGKGGGRGRNANSSKTGIIKQPLITLVQVIYN
jgi:hypothetical protein